MSKIHKIIRRKKPMDWVRFLLTWAASAASVFILVYIVAFVFIRGIPHITSDLFALQYTTQNQSLIPALVTTIIIICITLVIAVPLGICTAIYLVEYSKRGSKPVQVTRATTETLAGIPSIVFGLFGYIFFAGMLGWRQSLLAGCFTMAIMILPLIIRTTEESLKSIPDEYREGSFSLGAGKLRTVWRVILPSAAPGIFAGIVLSVGRIVGETAALIYTIGNVIKMPDGLLSQGRTLALHVYQLSVDGLHVEKAYATAVILLSVVFGINALSRTIERRFTDRLTK